MNGKVMRYGRRKTSTVTKDTYRFGRRVWWQTGISVMAFLICLPVSKTDIPLRTYISRSLTVNSDIETAKIHFKDMCSRLDSKYPPLANNAVWSGFMELIRDDKPTLPVPVETINSAEHALELVVNAESAETAEKEFVYPENVNMVMPLSGPVTSPFGIRVHPVTGEDASHYGVDIAGDRGDNIISTAPGKVIEVKVHDIYGNCILIQHTERIKSFYAHLDSVNVADGDIVGENTVIGTVGSTGVVTGPHLHFGVRVDDEPTDPEKYIVMEHR